MKSGPDQIEMLVFLREGEDVSYDQLAQLDRLNLKRKPVQLKTFDLGRDRERAESLRVEDAPSILLVKNGEILKRLNGLTDAAVLDSALQRVESYVDPFSSSSSSSSPASG